MPHQGIEATFFLSKSVNSKTIILIILGLEETFGSYSSFESTYGASSYDARLKAASKIVSKTKTLVDWREVCEADLKANDFSLFSFHHYINSVKKWKYKQQKQSVDNQGFEKEIKSLYQRASKIHYYDAGLWISYLSFLSTVDPSLMDKSDLVDLASRAAMSSFACMSNPELWALYLLFLVNHFPLEIVLCAYSYTLPLGG